MKKIIFYCLWCASSVFGKESLMIFHAGSLAKPLKIAKEKYQKEHPEVEIFLEGSGSRDAARKISDLKKSADLFFSADYKVIDDLLIPEHASWNIAFAANEMAIVYHEDSRFSKEINAQNWYEILQKPQVIFGRSEPNADPCGYRAVLTMQLAENFYQKKGLQEALLKKDNAYIRPKEVDLLALLESKTIDYIFLYKSVAVQHKLKYITLPDEINLRNPQMNKHYEKATLKLRGKTPQDFVMQKGEAMVYGLTIPHKAQNKKGALSFLNFFLSSSGMKIMEEEGQPSLIPSYSPYYKNIPQELQKFAKEKE